MQQLHMKPRLDSVDGSSLPLTCQSTLRCSNLFLYANATNEGVV